MDLQNENKIMYSLHNTGIFKVNAPIEVAETQIFKCKIVIIFFTSVITFVLGAQKPHHTERVILSVHNACFG